MYFKSVILFLASLMILTFGCGIKVGEKNKTENIAEIKSAACLDSSISNLKLFFSGDANEKQVSDSLVCLQTVVKEFKENIRGKSDKGYTSEEISNFIKKKFLKDGDELSSSLMAEVFKLKVLLVGGDDQMLSKSEIDGIASLIARLQPELVKLNPYMKIIVSKWVPDADLKSRESKFNSAKSAFESFLNHIALVLSSTNRSYELENLLNLVIEVAKYSKSDEQVIKKINNARAFLLNFKLTLIGGNSSLIGNEWVPFSKSISEALFQLKRFEYFYKDLNENQIAEKWKVYELVAVDISNLIKDLMIFKGSTLLKNQEIIDLLISAKPLLGNIEINENLVRQIGKLKVVFLGNHKFSRSEEGWNRSDFNNLSLKLPLVFKNIVVILQNSNQLKINTTGFRKNEIKYDDFNKAEPLIIDAIKNISETVVGSYDLDELKMFLQNLSETLLKDTLKLPDKFSDLMELVKAAKYTLTGELGANLSDYSIKLLLNVGVRGYSNYVEFSNFVNVFKLDEKDFIFNFDKMLVKVKETLAVELKMKTSHMIVTNEFAATILAAQDKKFIDTKLTTKGIESVFNALWLNILNKPEDRLGSEKKFLPGLNGAAVQMISTELHFWVENQKVIAEIFAGKSEYLKVGLLTELSKKKTTSSLAELIRGMTADGLMIFDEKKYLKILTNTYENGFYHFSDVNFANLSKTISRLVIRSYASELEKVNNLSGITLEEAEFAFQQLSEFAFDLGLVERENIGFISSRFRESNLFLAVSNGDALANFEEIDHLILHILSGSARAANLKDLAMEKCLKVKSEILSKNQFGLECLLNLYYTEDNSFADLPVFLKLKTEKDDKGELKYSEKVTKDYYLGLLSAAGYIPKKTAEGEDLPDSDKTIYLSDANLFPHVVQYVEMVFFRFDANQDGYLQKEEALKAYPVFENMLKLFKAKSSFLKDVDDKALVGVFVWLLKTGTVMPLPAMKKFAADYECNLKNDSSTCTQNWTVNSTRLIIGKIFKLIATVTAPKPPPPPPGPSQGEAASSSSILAPSSP